MDTRENSIKALRDQIKSGKRKTDSVRLYQYAKNKTSFTIVDVIEDLGLKPYTATGRISDLLDLGLIEKIGNRYIGGRRDQTYNLYCLISDPNRQIAASYERRLNKYIRWKDRGLKDFVDFIKYDQQFKDQVDAA